MSHEERPSIDSEQRLEAFLRELYQEFPALQILPKEQIWHQKTAGLLLKIITFGSQNAYLSNYTTTLGTSRIYTPSGWARYSAAQRYIILRHERAHLRQFRRYGFFLMLVLYGFLPLPAGLSYFRMRFEREGYEESIRASKEMYGAAHVQTEDFQNWIISQFTSGAYGWMWPFPKSVKKWVQAIADEAL
jgi:hypothetical protein